VPSSLTLLSEYNTTGFCYSATHRENGEIIIGTQQGTQSLKRNGRKLIQLKTHDKLVTGVVRESQNIYILHTEENTDKVEICLANSLKQRKQLFRISRKGDRAATLAVSKKYVVANNPDTNQLIVYNPVSKCKRVLNFGEVIESLNFLPDGHLLAVGEDKITKYRIGNRTLDAVWACNDVIGSCSVCSDENGLLYVLSEKVKTLYVISN